MVVQLSDIIKPFHRPVDNTRCFDKRYATKGHAFIKKFRTFLAYEGGNRLKFHVELILLLTEEEMP